MRWQTLAFGALLVVSVAACSNQPSTLAPPPTSAAVLQQILTDCWGVTQLKQLDGTRPEHTRAFECARPRLLQMTQSFPDAAEPHRLLGWGYYFALQEEDAARAEYERAAAIYQAEGHAPDQADMLVQLASLALKYDVGRGCTLLHEAASTDPTNARAVQLLRNFACLPATTATPTPTTNG